MFQSSDDDIFFPLLADTNNLLTAAGIGGKQIASISELSRVASSMFVAIFEAVYHTRVDGIVRKPQSNEDYTHNAQTIIDRLSDRIKIDLQHIPGHSIASGDMRSISNLVDIFARILLSNRVVSDGSSDHLDESISTHESTFEQLRPTSTPTLTEAHSTESHFKPSTATSSRLPVHSKELLSSHQNLLLQKEKLEQARKRREGVRKVRESRLAATNRRRAETSLIARQQHWAEDFQRAHDSELLRRTCEEQVVMRKIYKAMLREMHQWRAEENSEAREKMKKMRDEATMHIMALQTLFEDRLQLLRDQEAQDQREMEILTTVHRDMSSKIKHSQKEKQKKKFQKLQSQAECQHELQTIRRREAHRNVLSLLSVESWEDGLRS